jgi:hypothetical protein
MIGQRASRHGGSPPFHASLSRASVARCHPDGSPPGPETGRESTEPSRVPGEHRGAGRSGVTRWMTAFPCVTGSPARPAAGHAVPRRGRRLRSAARRHGFAIGGDPPDHLLPDLRPPLKVNRGSVDVPRRGLPHPLCSAFAVFNDLDGFPLSGLSGVFQPVTLLGFVLSTE